MWLLSKTEQIIGLRQAFAKSSTWASSGLKENDFPTILLWKVCLIIILLSPMKVWVNYFVKILRCYRSLLYIGRWNSHLHCL